MTESLNPRKEAIKLFYLEIMGRKADEGGLDSYYNSEYPLEVIYHILYNSSEAKEKREREEKENQNRKLPLSLATFVKNNEDSIALCINSIKPIVSEIVVVDTGSSDNTIKICKDLGARVYQIGFGGFDGFGNARTITAHLAREPFVFMLDSDETVLQEDLVKFGSILNRMKEEDIDIVGLPRKRWLDLDMTTQVEMDVYPDFQFRLFKNKPEIRYIRRIHEIIDGSDKRLDLLDGPCIQHFQDAFKTGDRLKTRNEQYKELQRLDILEGVEHKEKAVQELDERK